MHILIKVLVCDQIGQRFDQCLQNHACPKNIKNREKSNCSYVFPTKYIGEEQKNKKYFSLFNNQAPSIEPDNFEQT